MAPGDLAAEVAAGATAADIRYVVVCNEGYSSSLAAATLRRLGLGRATDLIGGFQAWSALSADHAPAHAASSRRATYRAR